MLPDKINAFIVLQSNPESMKPTSITRIITGAFVFGLFVFSSPEADSQQLITFTNGSVLHVNIVYLTRDTVKYFKTGYPETIYTETIDRVQKIVPVELPADYTPGLQVNPLPYDKECLKYKKGTRTGGILMGAGAILTTAGVIGWTQTTNAKESTASTVLGGVFSVLGMTIGSGLFISGGIIAIVNASNLSACKKEKQGFSLNLKATPQMTGISVAYRF
jgi:hypothetical protein